jgi:hypothetical protein
VGAFQLVIFADPWVSKLSIKGQIGVNISGFVGISSQLQLFNSTTVARKQLQTICK